ncbi:astacin [Ancylostoma ceylanicum]|uniref:Metalloendopeptidase n=1 Tax=Ancylostoma ceylanicum TaxID=53326 RepID=A0A0D6M250_9BILA|nr:astacin [Ancylostoma ceylanicum]
MRLTLLLPILISSYAGLFDNLGAKIKTVFSGEGGLTERLKKALNVSSVLSIHERFEKLKAKIRKTIELSPEMLRSLKERLKINGIHVEYGPRVLTIISIHLRVSREAGEKMRNAFIKGAKAWEENTCIDFRERETDGDRLYVFPEDGCWSLVGRRGGKQSLSLGTGCESVGTAAHEIGHTLGLFHTMSRYDRDDYITVNAENVKHDWLDQFTKETMSTNNNFGLDYDCGSIMHYGGTSASRNSKPTMVPFDINYQETLGSEMISFIDLSLVNEYYGCKEKCNPEKSANCGNGGFPHPRDCNRCICPGGYGGRLCTERPPGCGEVIQAKREWGSLTDVLGYGTKSRDDYSKCNYWIQSPRGTHIEVKLVSFDAGKGLAVDGCYFAGVEIKTIEDQTLTVAGPGPRNPRPVPKQQPKPIIPKPKVSTSCEDHKESVFHRNRKRRFETHKSVQSLYPLDSVRKTAQENSDRRCALFHVAYVDLVVFGL